MPRSNLNLTFEQWLAKLDDECQKTYGIPLTELPARPYREWFEDSLTWAEVWQIIVVEEESVTDDPDGIPNDIEEE
jgi:hypothetical protein